MCDREGGQISETDRVGGASGGEQGLEQHQSSDNGRGGGGGGGGGESSADRSGDEQEYESSDEETGKNEDQVENEDDEAGPSVSRRDKGKGRYISSPMDHDEALAREIQAAEYNRMGDTQNNPSSSSSGLLTVEPRLNRFAPYTSREVATITSRIQRRRHRGQATSPSSLSTPSPFPWAASAAARGPLAHKRDTEAILAIADAFLVRQPRVNLFSASADRTAYMKNLHAIFTMAIDIYRRAVPESSRTGIPVLGRLMFLASMTRGDAGIRLDTPAVAEGSGTSSTRPLTRVSSPALTTTVTSEWEDRVRGRVTTDPVHINEPGHVPRHVITVRLSPEEPRPSPATFVPQQQQQLVQEHTDSQDESPYHIPISPPLVTRPSNPLSTARWDTRQTVSGPEAGGPSTISRRMQTYLDSRLGPTPIPQLSEGLVLRSQRSRSTTQWSPEPAYTVPSMVQRPPPPQRPLHPTYPATTTSSIQWPSSQRFSELFDPTPSSIYGSSRQWSPEPANPEPSSSSSQGSSDQWYTASTDLTSSSIQGPSTQWYPESTHLGLEPYPIQRSTARGVSRTVNPTAARRVGGLESFYLRYPEPTSSASSFSSSYPSSTQGSSFLWYAHNPAFGYSVQQASTAESLSTLWYSEGQQAREQYDEESAPALQQAEFFSTPRYPEDPIPGILVFGMDRPLSGPQSAPSQQGALDNRSGAYTMTLRNEEAGSILGDPEGEEEGSRSDSQISEVDDQGQDQDTEFLYLGGSSFSLESLSESDPETPALLREPAFEAPELLSESDSEDLLQQPNYSDDAVPAASDRFTTPNSSPILTQELTLRVSSGADSPVEQEEEEGGEYATASLDYFFGSESASSDAAVDDTPEAIQSQAQESSVMQYDQDPQPQSFLTQSISSAGTDGNNDITANLPLLDVGDSTDHASTTTEACSIDYNPDSPFSPDFSSPSPPPPPASRSPHPREQQRWNARMIRSLGEDLDGHLASGETSSSGGSSRRKRKRTEVPRPMSTRQTRVSDSEDDGPTQVLAHGSGSREISVSTQVVPLLMGASSPTRSAIVSTEAEGSERNHGSRNVATTTGSPLTIGVSLPLTGASSPATTSPALVTRISSPVTGASPPVTVTPPLMPAGESSSAASSESPPSVPAAVAAVAPVGPRRSLRIRARDAARVQQQQLLQQQSAQGTVDNEEETRSSSASRRGKKRGGAAMARTTAKRGKM